MIWNVHSGSGFFPHPGSQFKGSKKALDPGSATLNICVHFVRARMVLADSKQERIHKSVYCILHATRVTFYHTQFKDGLNFVVL